MERIGSDVEHQLSRFGGLGAMPQIVSAWPAVVGDEIARNAWPARVARDGTLRVHTSSSVWAFELGQLAPRILEQLVAELGEAAPAAVRFTPGHLPEPAVTSTESSLREPPEPSRETLAEAASMAAGIADDGLRERVARAAALSLARSRSEAAARRSVWYT